MERKSIIIGLIIGVVVVVAPMGAVASIDKLAGVGTPEVTTERINDTHAAITWSTEKPAHAYVTTSVSRQCGPGGTTINSINVSSIDRTHLIIAPIYDLNRARVNQSRVPGNGSLKWYEVNVLVMRNGSGASETIIKRNLSQACQ